jgi:transposase InsO family protein
VRRPRSNGIVERLHRTLLDGHFRVEGRRTWFETLDEMQVVLDSYLDGYNQRRPHQGRGMLQPRPSGKACPAQAKADVAQTPTPKKAA